MPPNKRRNLLLTFPVRRVGIDPPPISGSGAREPERRPRLERERAQPPGLDEPVEKGDAVARGNFGFERGLRSHASL